VRHSAASGRRERASATKQLEHRRARSRLRGCDAYHWKPSLPGSRGGTLQPLC
jgi:hypothetical protein